MTVEAVGSQLLVASAGGHLHEMLLLRDRFAPSADRTAWVTYGTPDASARLAGEDVTICHWPTHRNVPNAARNLRLAGQLLRGLRPDRVVSTGAAVAVPFLVAAARQGIPGYFIESAARVDGPSLSGRLVQRLTPARAYAQHATWSDGRFRYVGDVFERFAPLAAPATVTDRPLRLVVALGTHVFPFDRLLHAVAAATTEEDEVLAQVGPSTAAPAGWEVRDSLPPDELADRVARADVVVCHAGVGLALTALSQGRVPILCPRSHDHREAVDDHQRQLATALAGRSLARAVQPEALTRQILLEQVGVAATERGVSPGAWPLE